MIVRNSIYNKTIAITPLALLSKDIIFLDNPKLHQIYLLNQ